MLRVVVGERATRLTRTTLAEAGTFVVLAGETAQVIVFPTAISDATLLSIANGLHLLLGELDPFRFCGVGDQDQCGKPNDKHQDQSTHVKPTRTSPHSLRHFTPRERGVAGSWLMLGAGVGFGPAPLFCRAEQE